MTAKEQKWIDNDRILHRTARQNLEPFIGILANVQHFAVPVGKLYRTDIQLTTIMCSGDTKTMDPL